MGKPPLCDGWCLKNTRDRSKTRFATKTWGNLHFQHFQSLSSVVTIVTLYHFSTTWCFEPPPFPFIGVHFEKYMYLQNIATSHHSFLLLWQFLCLLSLDICRHLHRLHHLLHLLNLFHLLHIFISIPTHQSHISQVSSRKTPPCVEIWKCDQRTNWQTGRGRTMLEMITHEWGYFQGIFYHSPRFLTQRKLEFIEPSDSFDRSAMDDGELPGER